MEMLTERHYTLDDVWSFPNDGLRREIVDGVLYVSPQPRIRHQRVVLRLIVALAGWVAQRGGDVFAGANVDLAPDVHLEPDVVVTVSRRPRDEDLGVTWPPDLVAEVSSPSTRRYDMTVKRAALERWGVPEYWFVDIERDEVFVYRLSAEGYDAPTVLRPGETLTATRLPGLRIDIGALLARDSE